MDENNTNAIFPSGSVPSAPRVPVEGAADSIFRDDLTSRPTELRALAEERARLKAERELALTNSPPPFDLAMGANASQTGSAANNEATQVLPVAADPVLPVTPGAPAVIDKSLGRKPMDGFFPSIGLFIARLAVAAILGIHGMDAVTHIADTQVFLAKTLIPAPEIMAWVLAISELAIAIALIFGLLTRLAGVGVVTIGLGANLFYNWGPWSIFVEGQVGFLGDHELLIAAMGLVFVTVGAGGWSLDRSFRVGRARDKADQALARSKR